MESTLNEVEKKLRKYNQEHVIPFLENGKNEKLINQIINIDFEELKYLYNKTKEKETVKISDIEPVKSLNPCKLEAKEIEEINRIGENIIINNKFAVSTMAGRSRDKTWTQ